MFRKILIANRGEIACRVIRTARRLGINTVSIYSDIDMNSKHVSMADYAYYVGGNKSKESYLNMNKIIEVALSSGAEAIHPGYGFLSENCDFVNLCEQNNIKFIGPPFQAISAMGSKIESKKLMEKANVPVVPGYFGDNQDRDFLIHTARSIGYPVLIKADLGGGGKGMRIVYNDNEFFDALNSAQNEASKSFGSAKILLEKYIANSRHIEVQVFGDNYGNYVHLFERDCTIQRRHQKVVEEAPSYLKDDIRSSLCNSAVTAAKAVGYVNAGTVEFIYDIDQSKFYFMEMNTRLQVEHPITEMITNQDLVEWQLLIASGSKLPKKQEEIKKNGHAIELRIYSEDPQNQFLPGTGKIIYLNEPNHRDSANNPDKDVRVETGIRQGDEVSVFYDPMISKLVCWAPTRDLAIKKTIKLLEEYKILGLPNNIKFVKTILEHPKFKEWNFDTNFIGKHKDDLINVPEEVVSQDVLATILCKISNEQTKNKKLAKSRYGPWAIQDNFRVNHKNERKFNMVLNEKTNNKNKNISAIVKYLADNRFNVRITGVCEGIDVTFQDVKTHQQGENDIQLDISGHSIFKAKYYSTSDGNIRVLKKDGSITNIDFVQEDFGITDDHDVSSSSSVKSPMPSSVSKIFVKEGQEVKKGDNLISLEAMKMEHILKASRDGKIKAIYATESKFVDANSVLIEFEN